MLDIGVVSYSGAHLNGLNGNEADCDSISFGPASWRGTVKRYKLECLDDFHLGNPVWAFTVPTWEPDRPLYLSTTVETFADIWGPLWKCNVSVTSGRSSYVVGSGVLEPWRHQAIHPPLKGEVFCHWVSNEGYEEAVSTGNALNVHVAVSDQILIGAPKNIQHGLTINLKCTPPISNYRAQFKDLNRLCIMGASRPYSYNDSNQFQLQVGYSGVNMSATKQYKRMPGQSLKKAFAEIWAMMPQLRDPKLLIDLHGVEVSLCTKNSRRVSLGQLLSLGCMRLLLRDFRWDRDQYRDEYFATLLDPARTLSRDDAAFKQNFDQAVMLCLNVLEYSGVDRKENLIVFMASKCTAKPELATLMSSEHSWIKLLRDTTTNCAMAVFGDHCLEFHHNLGVLCGATGRSVLSTALELNGTSQLPMILGLHSITPGWDVTRLEIGKTFWLGEQGTLSVKSHLQDGMLLVEGDRQLFQQPSRC
ncbi:hypothetical protein PVAG01_04400 [Phlyctema vagabunda]|uniref:Uncharacterized protein n=1 Tax=Phlyctema vagabunda TaxID=108571 RepID=A0ABR4PP91_9HELO